MVACYYVTDDGFSYISLSGGHKPAELPAECDEKMNAMLDAGGGKTHVIDVRSL